MASFSHSLSEEEVRVCLMYSHETIYKMSAPFFGEEEKIIIFFLT